MKDIAEQIFLAGVDAVLPEKLIRSQVKLSGNFLHLAEWEFPLSRFRQIYLLAAGKAAAAMACEMERLLGDRIRDGHIITKYGHGRALKRLTLTEAGHPVPDAEGVKGTQRMLDIARKAGENDLVVCLLSGGASALMADLPEGISLDDLKRTNELLVTCGADIAKINIIRKHLSGVKGGELARTLFPATTVSLILSDVVGNRLEVIASGPTAGDRTNFADAMDVINSYSLKEKLPASVLHHLQKGVAGSIPDTPKPDDPIFQNVYNYVIGSNSTALRAAAQKAEELGCTTEIVTETLQGDYTAVADYILDTVENYQRPKRAKPLCLLFGGEPTVKVSGNGKGGRNQHLALYLATRISPKKRITILCAGTDGTDGPTDAAGAVIDDKTVSNALERGINPYQYLNGCDSYHFFQQAGGHIMTGNTGTNVMDMIVAIGED